MHFFRNPRKIWPCFLAAALIFSLAAPAAAAKLVAEARSVVEAIQQKSSGLSTELTEFHTEFSAKAARMVQLETMMEELKEKGYLGKTYEESPEKYERIYAEYARYMTEIKDTFMKYAPKIQSSVKNFNASIYRGRDRIMELRSDNSGQIEGELIRVKDDFARIKAEKTRLESQCPRDGQTKMSSVCRSKWSNYQRRVNRLKQHVARMKFMRKMASLKTSIIGKLTDILDQYVDKEANTVDMLLSYASNFEEYGSFIGSKDLGGMLQAIQELRAMNETMRDFQQFQQGLTIHVEDMGNLVNKRLDHFMKNSGMDDMDVEPRSQHLQSYDDQIDQIDSDIRSLEKSLEG